MIVISSSLVLSLALTNDTINEDNPVIGWRNLVTTTNLSVDFENEFNVGMNLANPATHLHWSSTEAAEQFITVVIDSVEDIDYVGIVGHNFGSAQIPVSIEGDSGSGFVELTTPIMLQDDAPLLFRFVPQSLSQIRLRMQSGTEPPIAGAVYVGKLLVLERRIYVGHKPMLFNDRVDFSIGRSDRGQFLGSIILSAWTEGQLEQVNVTPGFYRTNIEPWRKGGVRERLPFFFAWRPGTYPLETAYCWPMSDLDVSNQRANGMMQFSLSMQGFVGF